jgi:hypothetical protein
VGTDRSGQATAQVAPAVALPDIITVIEKAYSLYKQFAGGGLSSSDATQQIIDAINTAKNEIIAHIDAVATANVQSCALNAMIDFPNFNNLTPDNQQVFALNATSCVTLADSLLGVVADNAAVDELGFALNSVGPIALITRSRTGLDNSGLMPVLHQANQVVFNQLIPTCFIIHEPGASPNLVECDAYNGDSDQELAGQKTLAKENAAARTSWPIAKRVLPLTT